ncbi:M4 family metallopeptidase [Longispora albida]|uniref:M4 family metallopeptidase n=1 Tax=Longispora albida TaxID=203523 RepID=UPI000381990A|nr:M4 family metallopeptidase [Longispora albida]
MRALPGGRRAKAAIALAGAALVAGSLLVTSPASAERPADLVSYDAAGRITGLSAAAGHTLRPAAKGDAAAQATAHLKALAGRFGVNAKQFAVDKTTALPGGTVVRFQQTIGGAPVLGGQLVAVLDGAGALSSLHGNTTTATDKAAKPAKGAGEFGAKTRQSFADEAKTGVDALEEAESQLAWFDPAIYAGTPSKGDVKLVWSVKVEPAGLDAWGGEVLYDATSGTEVLRLSHKHEALSRAICDANSTYVSTSAFCLAKGAARVEGGAVSGVTDVNDAFDLFGTTSSYYQTNFGYDLTAAIGSTGKGDNVKRLRAIVRACVQGYGCPMENAFWNGKGMTFGAGFASADDVIAHELTHGVTEHTSGLVYSSQSGAINEALSDIFGEYSDLTNGRGNDAAGVRWDMGEDLPASIGVIRSMSDPTRFSDPDKVSSSLWYKGTNNSAYVHINSGVGNKAAFLIADGGTFNGQTITGLGLAKAGQIFWRAQNTLTSSATYKELNTVLPAACRSLATSGTGGITAADCVSVDRAVLATEMNLTPAG